MAFVILDGTYIVKSDHSQSAAFAHLRTNSWDDVKTANPLYADRVRQAINQALHSVRWQRPPRRGDVTIFANGQIDDVKQLKAMYDAFGLDWVLAGSGAGEGGKQGHPKAVQGFST